MYSIAWDRDRAIVRVVLEGLWDARTVYAFVTDLIPLLKVARAVTGSARVLGDARAFEVQGADVIAAFERARERLAPLPYRMATFVGSPFAKMRADEVLSSTSTALFTELDDAERWLAAPSSEERAD